VLLAERMTRVIKIEGDKLFSYARIPDEFVFDATIAHVYCYHAAICVASAKGHLIQGEFSEAFRNMSLACIGAGRAGDHFDGIPAMNDLSMVIKLQGTKLNEYQKGSKQRAAASEQKWELAREYFIEEIPKHKTLKLAREGAAKRAGIVAELRHLVANLPDPRK
jgi:hypothetical protein